MPSPDGVADAGDDPPVPVEVAAFIELPSDCAAVLGLVSASVFAVALGAGPAVPAEAVDDEGLDEFAGELLTTVAGIAGAVRAGKDVAATGAALALATPSTWLASSGSSTRFSTPLSTRTT